MADRAAVVTGASAASLRFNNLTHASCDGFDTVIAVRTMSCDTSLVLQCSLLGLLELRDVLPACENAGHASACRQKCAAVDEKAARRSG